MRYRSDVDGLRAVAVIPVLLFHATFSLFQGGFVGVDVFFVISGFVITAKLNREIEEGRLSFRAFYAGRVRRLMPAMAAVMLAVFVFGYVAYLPSAFADLCNSILATLSFSANVYFWRNSGYFEPSAQTRPLLHMWSLAVEEQFYLFIPLLLYVLKTHLRRATILVFVVMALASLGLSVAATNVAPTANFFLLPTRAWELLLGSLLALVPLPQVRQRGVREALGLLAAILLIAPVFAYSEAIPFPGLAALPPTLGAALAIYVGGCGPSLLKSLLSQRPVVWVGAISYSLYLVHWPIIVFVRNWQLRDPTLAEAWLIAGLSFLAAWASWRFIETPFRRGTMVKSDWGTLAAGGGVIAVLACLGLTGVLTDGLKQRFPNFDEASAEGVGANVWKTGRCFLQNQKAEDWAGAECIRTTGGGGKTLLWGDSFAAHYVVGLIANGPDLATSVVQYTFAGCPPVLGYRSYARPGCEAFNARIFEVIREYGVEQVVIAARWDQLRQRGISLLTDTVDRLQAAGVKVFVIGQSPMFAFETKVLRFREAGFEGGDRASWFVTFDRSMNDHVRAAAGSATFIDPLPTFCRDGRCDYMRDGKLLFGDYGHFSAEGSRLAVRAYFPGMRRTGKEAAGQ